MYAKYEGSTVEPCVTHITNVTYVTYIMKVTCVTHITNITHVTYITKITLVWAVAPNNSWTCVDKPSYLLFQDSALVASYSR